MKGQVYKYAWGQAQGPLVGPYSCSKAHGLGLYPTRNLPWGKKVNEIQIHLHTLKKEEGKEWCYESHQFFFFF